MDNFDYVAHITFINHNNQRIPRYVVFTSKEPPFISYAFAVTLPENVSFTFEDVIANQHVDVFPINYFSNHQPTKVQLSELSAELKFFYEKFLKKTDAFTVVVAAVGRETFLYLRDCISNVMLLETDLLSHELTFAAVTKKYYSDRKWRDKENIMSFTNRVVELNIDDSYENVFQKMLNMPLEQLESEYQRYKRCAVFARIIGLFLAFQNQSSIIKLMYDDSSWYLSFQDNFKIPINFEKTMQPEENQRESEGML